MPVDPRTNRVIVPQYRGGTPLEEEGALLYLLTLVGATSSAHPDGPLSLGSMDSEEVLWLYAEVQRALTVGAPHAPSGTLPPVLLCFLEMERCYSFLLGSLNCHLRAYGEEPVNDSDHLENALQQTYWRMSTLKGYWEEMEKCLLLARVGELRRPYVGR